MLSLAQKLVHQYGTNTWASSPRARHMHKAQEMPRAVPSQYLVNSSHGSLAVPVFSRLLLAGFLFASLQLCPFPLCSHSSLHLHCNSDMPMTTGFLLVLCHQLRIAKGTTNPPGTGTFLCTQTNPWL